MHVFMVIIKGRGQENMIEDRHGGDTPQIKKYHQEKD